MLKKKFIKIIVVILLTIMLTGQTKCPIKRTSTETGGSGALAPQVYIGTIGLQMNFVNNLPPSRIYTTMPLNVMVEVWNRGAIDIESGFLRISGFDPMIIRFNEIKKDINIPGKTRFNLEGNRQQVTFSTPSFGINKELFTDFYKPRLVVTACYEYKTDATAVLCIDPLLYDVEPGEKACVATDVGLSAGQGAPVAVSAVSVDTFGSEAHVKITITNANKGTVLRTGSAHTDRCPTQLTYNDLNFVDIESITLSGRGPTSCEPKDEITLINKRATVYCTFPVDPNAQAYKAPLRMQLKYGYMESISKDIEIVKIETRRR